MKKSSIRRRGSWCGRKVFINLSQTNARGSGMKTKYKKIGFEVKIPDDVNIEEIRESLKRIILRYLKEEGLSEKELEKVKISIELVEGNEESES